MNNSKQALAALLTVIVIMIGYVAYTLINDKIANTFYYVVFDSNGGSSVETVRVKMNETVEKPINPIKEGYEFKYWTLDDNEYDFNSKVKSDIKLEAEWEEIR